MEYQLGDAYEAHMKSMTVQKTLTSDQESLAMSGNLLRTQLKIYTSK